MIKTKKTIYIQWMHCASCEMIIKKYTEDIDGVKVQYISTNKWMMEVEVESEEKLPLIYQCICDAWYKVIQGENSGQPHVHRYNFDRLLLSIGIVSILVFIFYKFDVVQYLPSVGDNASLGVALLMWIVASVSTCLAIVGSIVIGLSTYGDTETWTKHHIRTQVLFHAGRVGGFFILWWLLGLIGQAIAISLTTTTILTIGVGIVVLWMWLHLLHIVPNITSLGVHLPKSRSEKTLTTKNPIFAPLIGVLTFFLPCGFTLSMQLIAVHTGSFLQWGLTMAIFALWTMPVLFAIGLGSSYIKEKKFKLLQTIIGTLIVFFGIWMIINGWRLLWWVSVFTGTQQTTAFTGTYERREVSHDGRKLVPEIISLTVGKSYELVITPSDNGKWCMVTLTIPELDRSVHTIIKGQPIIYKFTAMKAGTYNIVCATMWMEQWKILVQ